MKNEKQTHWKMLGVIYKKLKILLIGIVSNELVIPTNKGKLNNF